MACSKFFFYDLNDYALMNIVQYLDFGDLVRCERVDKHFREMTERVFLQKQVFATAFIAVFETDKCCIDKHRFRQCDVFLDTETDYWCNNRSSFKILKRCKNLRALHWHAHPFSTNWGKELAPHVPALEHVYFRDLMTFSGFTSYTLELEKNEQPCEIRCVHLGLDDDDISDTYSDELYEFFKRCLKLENYLNFTCYNTIRIISLLIDRLVTLEVSIFDDMDRSLEIIEERGLKLRRLRINELLGENHCDSIFNPNALPSLNSITLSADPKFLNRASKIKKKWQAIEWVLLGGMRYNLMDLRLALNYMGNNLKEVRLLDYNLKSISLAAFVDNCPHLEVLGIFSERPIITDLAVQHIGKLKNLRNLEMRDTKMTTPGMLELINMLPKLRTLSLCMFKADLSIFPEGLQQWAAKNPKRRFTVYLDYGLLNEYKRLADIRLEPPRHFRQHNLNLSTYFVH